MSDPGQPTPRCPWCGTQAPLVHVHGHAQCGHCGANVEPCCGGGDAGTEAATPTGAACWPDPGLFARLFLRLGGPEATVTTTALLQALVTAIDGDLESARLVLEAGERIGLLVPCGPGRHRLRRGEPA